MTEKTRWQVVATGAGIVVVTTFGFFLLFFNRFAGVRTINGSGLAGSFILSGRIPYRDGFAATPPLFALENALSTWLFGTALIVQRIVGVFERALLATVLYLWLSRLFRISSATLGAIVAIVVSAGDITDPISSYNHDTILWAIAAGLFASICLEWMSNRTASWASFLCGISASLCLCDKQTIGLGITVGVPVLVAASLWRSRDFRVAGRFVAWFCTGWVIPIATLSYWLYSHGALGLCVRQLFLDGPSAKAGAPTDFVMRWIMVTYRTPYLRAGFIIAAILLILVVNRLFYPVRLPKDPGRDFRALVFVAGLSVVSIGLGVGAAYAGLTPWAVVVKASIYFTLMACGILAAVFSLGFLFGKLNDFQRQFWLLGAVGFVCAFMLSLSWPAFEAMVIPGLGFLVAAFLDSPSRRARAACYLASGVLLFSLVVWKLCNPFGFADWSEPPVMAANTTPSLPELWGFRLPQPEVAMLEGAARIIREHSTAQDTIFTYPSMPIFYAISHRWWPGYTEDHNIDACPDNIAQADAARILQAKPAVIIYYRQTPEYLKSEEALWRDGKRSGQRDIIAAVEKLVRGYKLAASYDVPTTKLKLDVYVRH
ncbi:MAG TPA: hypothetical protein VMW54_10005 [Terriglobia bacterium]|nr:hypothetical protein [Terriglobia bacterium]